MKRFGRISLSCVWRVVSVDGYHCKTGMIDSEEIDFIGVKNNKPIYVQVAYVMPDKKTQEREFGNLLKIQDNYPKFVVSMDEVDMSQKGIVHMNTNEFLLNAWE